MICLAAEEEAAAKVAPATEAAEMEMEAADAAARPWTQRRQYR